MEKMKNLLDYTFPQDLKFMDNKELELLAVAIREFLVDKVSKTGGHLASNLGAVELTIALHKVFDTPKDKLIWDVGHQAYVHKILTGRAEHFDTLRQFNGLSGFPKQKESEYDVFDVGHSSNSISIATGFAAARDLNGENHEVIAVIGDGALTGGLSYEGLNNLADLKSKTIVVFNDNGMSIGKNTGGLSKHLNRLRVSKGYTSFKKGFRGALQKVPVIGGSLYSGVSNAKNHLKYSLVDGVMFEKLGYTYIGPIDGHDINALIDTFESVKELEHSVIVHVITKKGKGYKNAEQNPAKFHGIGKFEPDTGECVSSGNQSFSEIYGNKLIDIAKRNDKVIAISAAMIDGTGLSNFAKLFPNKTFDVGIAEGHAVTFAGALAKCGFKPFVSIYSTFLQRGYDNIIMDVCLQNVPVVFAVDRAGNVGADGETHHGMFDISYLKNIPNMTVLAPASKEEFEMMLDFAEGFDSPIAIRYPRGEAYIFDFLPDDIDKKAQRISVGKDVQIWAVGDMVKVAIEAAEILKKQKIDAGVTNVRFISPIDKEKLIEDTKNSKYIVTIEDGMLEGGFCESVASVIASEKIKTKTLCFGWPKKFIEAGATPLVMEKYGLSAQKIAERIANQIEGKA